MLSLPLAFFLSLPLGFPSTTLATDAYSQLSQDAQNLQGILQNQKDDMNDEATEAKREKASELFPTIGEAGSGSVKRTGDLASAEGKFISYKENGIPVILNDVPRTAWFGPYVRDMVNRGIASGYRDKNGRPTGQFGPERQVSVEELAAMVVRGAGIDPQNCGAAKNASAQKRWSLPFVACGESHSWSLFVDATVDVARPATRAEVIVTILQAFQVPTRQVSGSGAFKDVAPSVQFAPLINTAALDGLVSGYPGKDGSLTGEFRGDKPIVRAEVSKVMSLAMQLYAR